MINTMILIYLSILMIVFPISTEQVLFESELIKCSNEITGEELETIKKENSKVGIPLNTVISGSLFLTEEDYKNYIEVGINSEFWIEFGSAYIKPDNTLWVLKPEYDEVRSKEFVYEKIGEDVASVYKDNNLNIKLQNDGTLWKNYKRAMEEDYSFSKLAEDVVMIIPGNSSSIYVLKKDNTIWKVLEHKDDFSNSTPKKITDDVSFAILSPESERENSALIKTDGSLYQFKGENFDKLEKVTDNIIYVDTGLGKGLFVTEDKNLFLWNFSELNKDFIKLDDNVEYAKFKGINSVYGLKTDGSLWVYHYNDKESIWRNHCYITYTGEKTKKADNIEALLGHGLVKSKDGKILEINLEGEGTYGDPECTFFKVLEGYDIKTPELVDITKPFNKEQ